MQLSRPARSSPLTTALGALALTLGLRFQLLQRYASDLPFHDQWDAEGLHLLRPWKLGAELGPYLLRFHNEHHPVLTKLIALGFAAFDGMWSALPQQILNTFLQGAIVLLVAHLARRHLAPLAAWTVAVAAAVVLSLPILWENLLWGFQSQFYLAILGGLLHAQLIWSERQLGWRWALGVAVGVVTLGTIAAGFLSVTASGLVALTQWRQPGPSRRHAVATMIAAALISFAGASLVHPVPNSAVATTPFSALEAFAVLGGWPVGEGLLAALVVLFPPVLFVAGQVVKKTPLDQPWLLAVVTWLVAVTAAFAYGRAELIGGATPRYCDFLAVGCLTGLIVLLRWTAAQTGAWWRVAAAVTVAWIATVGTGFGLAVRGVLQEGDLRARAELQAEQVRLVRTFVATDNPAVFDGDRPTRLIHESSEQRLNLLRDTGLRALLPPSVRAPLAIVAAENKTTFTRERDNAGVVTWRSPADPVTAHTFASAPLEPEPFPLLRFRVTGGVDGRAHQLILRETDSGRVIAPLSTTRGPGAQTLNFEMPRAPFRVEATVAAASGPLAFSEPVSISRLTRLSGKLLGAHRWFIAFGAGLLIAGGVGAALNRAGLSPVFSGSPQPAEYSRIALLAGAVGAVGAIGLLAWPLPLTFGETRAQRLFDPTLWSETAAPAVIFSALPGHPNLVADGIYAHVAPAGFFQGSYGPDGDASVAEAESAPFTITGPTLLVPVVGYPHSAGNRLALIMGDRTFTYDAPDPGERAQLWVIDVAAFQGKTASLHVIDAATGHQGWLGLASPWFARDARAAHAWKRLADSNRLPAWRAALAILAVAGVGGMLFAMRRRSAHLTTSRLRWS